MLVIESVERLPPRPPVAYESAVSKNPKMVGDVGHATVQEFSDVADAEFVLREQVYDLCPGWIPQGLEQLGETVQIRDGFPQRGHHFRVGLKHITQVFTGRQYFHSSPYLLSV